jgi:hypothetical protein
MHDEPGVGVECLLELFGAHPESIEATARANVGALLILEIVMLLRAIVKGLSSSG